MTPENGRSKSGYHEYWTNFRFHPRNIFTHPPHFHKDIEVVFVMDGIFKTSCDGSEYVLKKGSVFLCGSDSIHYSTDPEAESNSILLIIDPKTLIGPAAQLISKTPVSPVWENPTKDSFVWTAIQYAVENQSKLSSENLRMLISSVISLILQDMEMIDINQKEKIENKILQYCNQHFTGAISVKSMAHALSVSECYISRIFSNVFRCTFPQYINTLRIERATILLLTTNKSCTQIALDSGFSTLRTFNRVFLQKYGITPLQYRKRANASKTQTVET